MKSILIIEDNVDIRENLAEILDLAGYQTYTAPNGKAGVELANKYTPDIIICDITMPELDGFGVLHLVKNNPETKHIPFIFLTAKTERSDLRKGMEMGADDFITKPFADLELLKAVETRLKKNKVLEKDYGNTLVELNAFFSDLEAAGWMETMQKENETEHFVKKQVLYKEGNKARFLFYILKGKVKVFKIHPDGKDYIIDIFGPGDFIGYAALIRDEPYEDNATAIEDAEILMIPKTHFQQLILRDLNVAAKFIGIITQNIKEKEDRLLNMAYSTLRMRVASALIELFSKNEKEEKGPVPLKLSREDLAQFIGTATESLIRTLSDFKSEKIIDIKNGNISITDIDKLRELKY